MLQRAIDQRLRIMLTPERVAELIGDLLAMLESGVGHIGLPRQLLDYFTSQLDIDELSAMLAPRLRHYLGVADG